MSTLQKVLGFVFLFTLSLTLLPINLANAGGCDIGVGTKRFGTIINYSESVFRSRFETAFDGFESELGGCPTNYVHWWEGLLVQDFNSDDNEHYAIFYDVNLSQGSGDAYVLWGPILQRYRGNSNWGPPTSDRVTTWPSPNGTAGQLVRFSELDVYFNDSKQESYIIRGVTRERYNQIGGTASFLGLPEQEGLPAIASGHSGEEGYYQPFEGGIMHTFEHQGVWKTYEVHGAIQATFNSLPGQGSGSQLGFPITGEIETQPSLSGRSGKVQAFEGGRIYYDSLTGDGVTYVLFNNVVNQIPGTYASSTSDARLGFPTSSQPNRDECRAFFEYGYVDCTGVHLYGASEPAPPSLSLPYRSGEPVLWTGGPHAHWSRPGIATYAAGKGSAIDFAISASTSFDVHAMTGGTVVEVEGDGSVCNSSLSLGCRIAIRSDYGGAVLIYSHLEPGSLYVTRRNSETNEETTTTIHKGMYVYAQERIARAGWSGQQVDDNGNPVIHLHIDFRDGTSIDKGNCATNSGAPHHCYVGTDGEYFGRPMDWDGLQVGEYRIFGFVNPANAASWFNYEGSAVKVESSVFNTKSVDRYYVDPVFGRQLARMTVHNSFDCAASANTCEVNADARTVFATNGCLDGHCESHEHRRTDENALLTSAHEGQTITYDPDLLTLASPNPDQLTMPTAVGLNAVGAQQSLQQSIVWLYITLATTLFLILKRGLLNECISHSTVDSMNREAR